MAHKHHSTVQLTQHKMRKNYQLSLDHIQLPQAETEFYFSDEEDQEHQQTHTKARGVIKQEVK